MELATEWGLVFRQDPAKFDSGTEWDMARRIASLTIAERLMGEAREGQAGV